LKKRVSIYRETQEMFKKILIALLICLSLSGYSQNLKDTWKKIPDDVKHVYAGVLISSVSGAVMYRLTDANTGWSVFAGFATGVTAGIGKELVWDKWMHRGVPNKWDAVDTGWGSLMGTVCVRVGIDIREKNIDRHYAELEKLKKQQESEEFQGLAPTN